MPTDADLLSYLQSRGLVYRLAELVQPALKEARTPYRLEARIQNVCTALGVPAFISRHKLKAFAEHPASIGLNLGEIVALETYFMRTGRGFDQIPLFRRVGLVGALRAHGDSAILIAAKPTRPNQTHYTRWDSRAHARVRGHLLAPGAIEEVDEADGARPPTLDVVLGPERAGRRYALEQWHRLIERDDTSLVSIGSPRASLASELMLARMLGLKPHGREHPGLFDPRLPFQFVWPEDPAAFPVGSTFALGPRSLTRARRRFAGIAGRIRSRKAAALACDHALHVAPAFQPKPWNTYGVIAVQRRAAGHLWVVLAGLSGPATLAAARLLPEFQPVPDHPHKPQTHSPLFWALVTAKISEGPGSPGEGDNRILDAWTLSPPRIHLPAS